MPEQDPTNFSARLSEAQRVHADFLAKYPSGWASTARRGIREMRAIRHEEIRIGHELTEAQRDEFLKDKKL